MTRRRDRANEQRRPADRRPGIVPGRRFALVLALAVGLLGCSGAVARADNSGPLVSATVYSATGTTTESVSSAQLQASSQCPVYGGPQVMDEMGRQGPVDVTLSQTTTWALSTILGCLQPNPVPIGSVQGVTVMTADGTPETDSGSEITPNDLKPLGQTDFNNPNEGPVVSALGTSNEYDRPWRGPPQSQPDDDYSDQVITGSPGGQPAPVEIEVFEGQLLTVTANASETTVPVGGTVSFSATVTPQNGGSLSYSWNFDGGAANSTASAPQATFGSAGQYDVTVQVTDAQGGGGIASIPITVGTPPAPTTGSDPQSGAGTNRNSHTPTGPKKSTGTHPGARPGTSKSSTSKSSTSTSGTGTRTSTTGTHTTSPGGTSTTSTQASTTSTHPATTSTPHHSTAPSTTRRRSTVARARQTRPPTSGPLVAGRLISNVTPLPAGVSPLVHTVLAPAAAAPPARQAIRASLLPAVGAGLAVLLLLGLGAGRELRGRSGRRTPRAAS